METVPKSRTFVEDRDLVLQRVIDAPCASVFNAWTTPALLKMWFAPTPWSAPVVETDLRVGGASLIVMRGPDGQEFPNCGVYLEIETDRKLVFTDAFVCAWVPSEKPFMVVTLTFEPISDPAASLLGKQETTQYTARVSHWTVADREAHEAMGFHEGWALCAEQLAALVERV